MRTILAAAAATVLLPTLALAQAFPAKPIRIVGGFTPGGSNDAVFASGGYTARCSGNWFGRRDRRDSSDIAQPTRHDRPH